VFQVFSKSAWFLKNIENTKIWIYSKMSGQYLDDFSIVCRNDTMDMASESYGVNVNFVFTLFSQIP
jgi:hypothetical protein